MSETVPITKLCVFLGSSKGQKPEYEQTARLLGSKLVERGMSLIFGGSHVGNMGILANQVLESGGKVIGIIPEAMVRRDLDHKGLTELRVVKTMHERKELMSTLSDAIIALPGGLGTLEEFFEAFTWLQLGIHRMPVGLLNVRGYFEPLLNMLQKGVDEGFVPEEIRDSLIVEENLDKLLDRLHVFNPPVNAFKWW